MKNRKKRIAFYALIMMLILSACGAESDYSGQSTDAQVTGAQIAGTQNADAQVTGAQVAGTQNADTQVTGAQVSDAQNAEAQSVAAQNNAAQEANDQDKLDQSKAGKSDLSGAVNEPLFQENSPEWVNGLAEKYEAEQLFVIAGVGKTTAYVSMHEKDENGEWKQIMTTPGIIGRNGLGKKKEGDVRTPVGVFHFNRAFGIAQDPGCAIPYHQVTEDDYWSGDWREGYGYNTMVSIKDLPDLRKKGSEHLIDYEVYYDYCLNISYNEECKPGVGSAIFLHCFGPYRPFTGGCVAIPREQMKTVMQNVREDCVVVIDYLETISPETMRGWGL